VYLADLPGCAVVTTAGAALGTIEAVDDFGAHPVLRVAPADGGALRLIPLVAAYVKAVDLAARVIEVEWEADY
jgi:16S rRNA processing protein RimM